MDSIKLHILQHSLGLDQYGQGKQYRNRFCTEPGSKDFSYCLELAEQGLMFNYGQRKLAGGLYLFSVTTEGEDYIARHSPKPPKLTRGQQRYRDYIEVADCFESFGHWLKYTAALKK